MNFSMFKNLLFEMWSPENLCTAHVWMKLWVCKHP